MKLTAVLEESRSKLTHFDIYKIADRPEPEEVAIGVTFIPPVWGSRMSAESYFRHIFPCFAVGDELLTPAEVGCTLAHLEIYDRIIEADRPALILEDDIAIASHDVLRVKEILGDAPAIDFLHLSVYAEFQFRGRQARPNLYIVDPMKDFWGTCAYYVSVKTASALKAFHAPVLHRADEWDRFFKVTEITPYFSPVFFHSFAGSSIQSGRNVRRPVALRNLIKRRLIRRVQLLKDRLPIGLGRGMDPISKTLVSEDK